MPYPYLVAFVIIAVLFLGLGILRPKYAFLALAFLLPLSHEGIQLAVLGDEPKSLPPLLITVAALSLFVALWLRDLRSLANVCFENGSILLLFLMSFMTAVAVNYSHNGLTHSVVLLDIFVGPMCLFLATCALLPSEPGLALPRVVIRVILSILLIAIVYGCFEYLTGLNPVMHRYLLTVEPPLTLDVPGERVSSFLGHYLMTASFFLFGMALAFAFLRSAWALLFGFFFYGGIVLTQSRAALVLGAVMYAYGAVRILARSPGRVGKRLATAASFLAAVPAVVLLMFWLPQTSLFTAIVDRFEAAPVYHRVQGLESLATGSWLGQGMGTGKKLADRLGSASGLENPWAYFVQEFGIMGTLFYLFSLIAVLLSRGRFDTTVQRLLDRDRMRDLKVFLLLQILMFSTFTGFGTRNNANYIVWFLAAVVTVHARRLSSADASKMRATERGRAVHAS